MMRHRSSNSLRVTVGHPRRRWANGYTSAKLNSAGRWTVSNSNTEESGHTASSMTIAEIVRRCQPMGDLGRFAIDDLTAAEEDEFFAILEDV